MSFGKVRDRTLTLKAPPLGTAEGDKRWSVRRKMQSPGLIYPAGMAASIPCTIADQSVTGARLEMKSGWINPFNRATCIGETFKLVMRIDRMDVDCKIVRIEDNTIGVRFLSVMRPIARRN